MPTSLNAAKVFQLGIFLQGVLNTVFTALVFCKCSQFTFEVAMQIAAFEIMALYLCLSKAPTPVLYTVAL